MTGERPSSDIDSTPGPLSEALYSSDFVMQAIEVLPVLRRGDRLWSMGPEHADSFVLAWPVGGRPDEVAAQAMAQLEMEATVLHSTSWRHVGQEVVLTYIAVVPPESVPPPSWTMAEVGRSELARGDATAPPSGINIGQVLEHALRHLAWLRQDDPVIAELLGDWSDALADYVPEPFRALGGPPV